MRSDARGFLAGLAVAADADIDLGETAVALAALSGGDREEARQRLIALAATTDPAGTADERADSLALMLSRNGFFADDEAEDAGLIAVLAGAPASGETSAVIAISVARARGWPCEMLSFSAAAVLRVGGDDGGRAVIEAGSGLQLDAPDLRALLKAAKGLAAELSPADLTPLATRDILIRMQNAAKLRRLRRGDVGGALATVEATLLFAPGAAGLWREAGLMHLKLENIPAAVASLEQFVARTPAQQARRPTEALLVQLKSRL